MCRLMGAVMYQDKEYTRNQYQLRDRLAQMFLVGELLNGGDGNGLAITKRDGSVITYRNQFTVPSFIYDWKNKNQRFSKRWNRFAKQAMDSFSIQLHTRLTTNGSSKNKDNLHPFEKGALVGCHNGTIYNHKSLWTKFPEMGKPYSENDSEIVISLLNWASPKLDDVESIQEALEEMYGYLACSVVSKEVPNKILLVSRERPLCVYEDAEQGILWYASTPEILYNSGICKEADATELKETGIIVDTLTKGQIEFKVKKQYHGTSKYYGGYYGGYDDYSTAGYGSYGKGNSTYKGGTTTSTAVATKTEPKEVTKATTAKLEKKGTTTVIPAKKKNKVVQIKGSEDAQQTGIILPDNTIVVPAEAPAVEDNGPKKSETVTQKVECLTCYDTGEVYVSNLMGLYDDQVIEELIPDFYRGYENGEIVLGCPMCFIREQRNKEVVISDCACD